MNWLRNSMWIIKYTLIVLLLLFTLISVNVKCTQYANIDPNYVVNVYLSGNFVIYISDIDTMFREEKLYSVKLLNGRINEFVLVSRDYISRFLVEERVVPSKPMDRILYEYSGYSLKASIGSSSYLYTIAIQGYKAFLHTVCLDNNFTLLFNLYNYSTIYSQFTTSSRLKTIILATKAMNMFIAIALHENFGIMFVNNNSYIEVKSRYLCLTLILIMDDNLSKLLETLNNISLETLYKYLENNKYSYISYISRFPIAKSGIKQLNDLYFIALYNRLNTLLYPEIYNLSAYETLVAHYITLDILSLFNKTLARKLASNIINKTKPTNAIEFLMYIKLSEFAEGLDSISRICDAFLQINASKELDIIITKKIEQICKKYSYNYEADIANLSLTDMLALSRLKLVKVSRPIIFKDITPISPWSCLAFTEALQQYTPYIHEVLALLPLDDVNYPCSDYAVLKGIAGIEFINDEIMLKPSIPKMVNELSINILIDRKQLILSYRGWGNKIKNVKLNGLNVNLYSIPLNMMYEGFNTIDIEMDFPPPITLEITLLYNNKPLKEVPVYMDIIGAGIKYSSISITDNTGRIVLKVLPNSYINIAVNYTEIGLIYLRTRVGENDTEMVIDIAKYLNKPGEISERLNTIEMKLQELENEIKLYTFQSQSRLDRDETYILLLSLTLFTSLIALALAITKAKKG